MSTKTSDLKKILNHAGWSTQMVANRWGVSPRQVSKVMNDSTHSLYQLYFDAAKNLPALKKNFMIRSSHDNKLLTLYEKNTCEKSFKICDKNNPKIYENKDRNGFLQACKEYITSLFPENQRYTLDIDDNVFIPRRFYDNPFEQDSVHMSWYLYITCRHSDENRANQDYETITKRLKEKGITFVKEEGLTKEDPVFIGSDGFLINQSLLKTKPQSLTIKRILSDEDCAVLKSIKVE